MPPIIKSDLLVSIHARHATGDKGASKAIDTAIVSIHARHATGDTV